MTSSSGSGGRPERTRYRCIIPHHSQLRVLLLAGPEGWVLPAWEPRERANWEEVAAVNDAVHERLGLRVATLRAVALDWDTAGKGRASYYLMDNLDPGWDPPPGARWLSRAELRDLPLAHQRERELLAGWFSELPSADRVPWYRPGWFESAAAWMRDELDELGIAMAGPAEQLRSWERSSILRAPTDAGRVYLKATPRQWGHEPGLTAYLARRFPDRMPEVLAADRAGGRMLMLEFPGRPVSAIPDASVWRAAYRAFAEVQIDMAGRLDDLRDLGMRTRALQDIEAAIERLLGDEPALLIGRPGGLSEDEVARLRRAIPRLQAACRRLAEHPIPLSLDHGDFWPGNIAAGDRLVLFDWSDATVSIPFFSLVMAVDEVNAALPDVPGAGQQVRDAYLEPWTRFEPMPRLREAFDLAMLVAPLHQALMYRDVYLPAMEQRWELERMLPTYLRWLVGRV